MAKERNADWERIEAQYSAGSMSLREIAAEHQLTEGAIRKRAKRDTWTRDLSAKVRAKADALVRKDLVRTEVRKETVTETVTVEVEATVQARIRLSHRTDIQRGKRITNSLMEELETQATKPKKLPLKERASILKQLTDTQRVQVALEREAFGIAQMVENTPDGSPEMTPERIAEGARRMAFVLHRAALLMKG